MVAAMSKPQHLADKLLTLLQQEQQPSPANTDSHLEEQQQQQDGVRMTEAELGEREPTALTIQQHDQHFAAHQQLHSRSARYELPHVHTHLHDAQYKASAGVDSSHYLPEPLRLGDRDKGPMHGQSVQQQQQRTQQRLQRSVEGSEDAMDRLAHQQAAVRACTQSQQLTAVAAEQGGTLSLTRSSSSSSSCSDGDPLLAVPADTAAAAAAAVKKSIASLQQLRQPAAEATATGGGSIGGAADLQIVTWYSAAVLSEGEDGVEDCSAPASPGRAAAGAAVESSSATFPAPGTFTAGRAEDHGYYIGGELTESDEEQEEQQPTAVGLASQPSITAKSSMAAAAVPPDQIIGQTDPQRRLLAAAHLASQW
jgi:hypothetical protein